MFFNKFAFVFVYILLPISACLVIFTFWHNYFNEVDTIHIGVGTLATLLGIIGMEYLTLFLHRDVWHNPKLLWFIHKSHHEDGSYDPSFEKNDLLGAGNAFPIQIALLIAIGLPKKWSLLRWFIGGNCLGSIIYGGATIILHDSLYHKRFWAPLFIKENVYLRRLAAVHHKHHSNGSTLPGKPPFGFFLALEELCLARQGKQPQIPTWWWITTTGLVLLSVGHRLVTHEVYI